MLSFSRLDAWACRRLAPLPLAVRRLLSRTGSLVRSEFFCLSIHSFVRLSSTVFLFFGGLFFVWFGSARENECVLSLRRLYGALCLKCVGVCGGIESARGVLLVVVLCLTRELCFVCVYDRVGVGWGGGVCMWAVVCVLCCM